MNNEIKKLKKISKKFIGAGKNVTVLKNINFKINKGELISPPIDLTGYTNQALIVKFFTFYRSF